MYLFLETSAARTRQSELRKHLVLHLLLPGHRQRHIDAAERHPIDEGLPLRPVVPDERVRVRAHIPVRGKVGGKQEIERGADQKFISNYGIESDLDECH